MMLTQKETETVKDLQSQEEMCILKYGKYKDQACGQELKNLFGKIEGEEQKHYDTLGKLLNGEVPAVDVNDSKGKDYCPQNECTTCNEQTKKDDSYLLTDAIASEKLISSEYNSDIFAFADPQVRNTLADIQVEEQNHAEMMYKYKEANQMTN